MPSHHPIQAPDRNLLLVNYDVLAFASSAFVKSMTSCSLPEIDALAPSARTLRIVPKQTKRQRFRLCELHLHL
jgi:hypothetical protein